MRTSLSMLFAVLLTATFSQALARQACVRCDNPFAIYNCHVDGPGVHADTPINLLCMTELAKRHGHATCTVSRGGPEECAGKLVTITPSPDSPLPQAPTPTQVITPEEADNPPPTDQPDTEQIEPEQDKQAEGESPQTVEELAKQTAKASQEGLKKAGKGVADVAKKTGETMQKTGNAIGSAAKKTWRCLSSFFGDC